MKKILVAIIFFTFSSNVFSQNLEPQAKIRDFIQNLCDNIIQVAKNDKLKEGQKNQKIIDLIDKSIDSKWISRFVLGRHYKTASEEQRTIFMTRYRDFMINTYGPKFNHYDGKKFTINSIEKQNNFYLVKSEFMPRESNNVIFFDFRVIENNGNLAIVDFIAEGVSLIETQRSEFNSLINQEGLDKFLETLKNRVATLKNNNKNLPTSKKNK